MKAKILTIQSAFACLLAFSQDQVFTQPNSITVKITWNANTEPDLAGYRIYWGTSSMSPQFVRDIAQTSTNATLELESPDEWFISLTAYNIFGFQSDPSNEIKVGGISATALTVNVGTLIIAP